jgi:hypothetical protein
VQEHHGHGKMLKVRHSCVRVFFSFSKFVFNFWPAFACWAFCLIGGDLLAGASSHHVGFDLRSRNRACVRKNNFQRMVSWLKEVFYLNFAKPISHKNGSLLLILRGKR